MAASIRVSPEVKHALEARKPEGMSWDQYLLTLAIPVADDVSPREMRIAERRLRDLREGNVEPLSGDAFSAWVKRELKGRKRPGSRTSRT